MFSSEYCETFKNSFFHRRPLVAASMPNVYEKFLLQKQPPKVFHKKTVLKNFAIFTVKHLCCEKRFQHMCSPVINAKFLRRPILNNICEWLLLLANVYFQGKWKFNPKVFKNESYRWINEKKKLPLASLYFCHQIYHLVVKNSSVLSVSAYDSKNKSIKI